MNTIESLEWRAAIKNFDTSKDVSQEDINTLVKAVNLAPTSGGLQAFSLIIVKNQEIKAKLNEHTYGDQVTLAPYTFVFAVDTQVGERQMDAYIDRTVEVRGVTKESMDGFKQAMMGYISNMPEEKKVEWATKQAYIALGVAITTAAQMGIDTCPMEGFNPMGYQSVLGLEDKGLMPVVILPIGYRSDEDVFSKLPKVRKKEQDLALYI